ncbi:hypothetical protein [Pedobacter caeni]|uniref:Uncharacterized protein n=1 Tax=Pedobacter caeni TaxID=288992 RepID=A0A1M4WVY9_9SPHI|nr:hypothetical protein [Pedobacter caeni]SHE85142.1 hypothetical protein SAMN04488522_1011397 [Pedobacter caeni]
MQHSVILPVTPESKPLWSNDPSAAVLDTLNAGAVQIELMLQGYHSREKVRTVSFDDSTLQLLATNEYRLKANYVIEEYSVCSAIDQVDSESMPLTVSLLSEGTAMEVKGIDLPEREPDSL